MPIFDRFRFLAKRFPSVVASECVEGTGGRRPCRFKSSAVKLIHPRRNVESLSSQALRSPPGKCAGDLLAHPIATDLREKCPVTIHLDP